VQYIETSIRDWRRTNPAPDPGPGSDANPDNPAYIQLQAQRQSVLAERSALAAQRKDLHQRLDDLSGRMASAPAVEREYTAMLRDLQGAQVKYQEVRQKQMAAQLAQNLEAEQKGERFTLIEPPLVPEQPASPNRPLLLLLGTLLSIAGAIGYAMLREIVDGQVSGGRDLRSIIGVAPLAVVPFVELDSDRQSARRRQGYWLAGAAVGLVVVALLVHFLYRPLDVLWHVLARHLGL
jgi:hypothetical protein